MKKLSYSILIAFLAIFCSCEKETTEPQQVESDFVYTKSVTIYTVDESSSVKIQLSSNDLSFVDETIENLKLYAGEEVFTIDKTSNSNQQNSFDNSSSIVNKRSIRIEIIEVNTEEDVIGLRIEKEKTQLKSVTPPWENTYEHVSRGNVDPYKYVRFDYLASDSYGIYAKPKKKQYWTSGWYYDGSAAQIIQESSEDGEIVSSPWNGNTSVYKHGFDVTTNTSESGNYTYIEATNPL